MDEIEKLLKELGDDARARQSLTDVTNEWDALCLEETVRISLTPEQQAAALYEAAPDLDVALDDSWEMGNSSEWNVETK